MTNAQYTPGPWVGKGQFTSDTEEKMAGMFTIRAEGVGVIAAFDKKEDRNLASLVPDFVHAAKELLQMIEAYELEAELDAGEDGKGPVANIRALITKAEAA